MLKESTIDKRINKLFDAWKEDSTVEWRKFFIDRLYEEYVAADHALDKSIVRFFVAWAIVYAVGAGLVSEGGFAGIKVIKLQSLLIFAPVLLGYMSYTIACAWYNALTLRHAFGLCIKYVIPEVHKNGLHTLLAAPTISGAEQMVGTEDNGPVSWLTSWFVILLNFSIPTLISLAAIMHAGYLIKDTSTWSVYAISLSVLIGATLWLRGCLLTYRAVMA